MRSSCPGVLGLALFLLLVLPPLLPSSGAYQHRAPTWLDFQHLIQTWRNLPSNTNQDGESTRQGHSQDTGSRERLADHKKSCQSNLDLYLILDKSGSVANNWIFTYGFVEDFLKMFQNPKMRVSIITFSTLGHTVLKLTSDKKEIEDGLNKLRNTVPTGDTNMQEGFKAVNEQIANANSGVKKVHSMVISLTDGALSPESFEATKNEAQRTRQLGGTVYAVGVNYYMKNQLLEIADSEDHVVGVDSGFYDLQNIVDSLADKSCIELTSVEPTNYCVGESSEALVFGRGFHNTKNKNEVLCRFQRSDTIYFDKDPSIISLPGEMEAVLGSEFRPGAPGSGLWTPDGDKRATQVEDTSIKCPGVQMEETANDISVEVSLNNGASFISNGLKISSKDCGGHRKVHPVDYPDVANVVAVPMKRNVQFPDINPYQLAIVLGIILTPAVIWLLWRFFSRKNKEPVKPCTPNCPAVVVPCGGCGERNMNQLEKKMDLMCNFFQNGNQRPVMPCQPTNKW